MTSEEEAALLALVRGDQPLDGASRAKLASALEGFFVNSRRLIEGEKRAWLTVIRGQQPLSQSLRSKIADILESYVSPKPGRPLDSEWAIANDNLKSIWLRARIEAEVAAMKARGEKPHGGRRAEAERRVAANLRPIISVDALKKRLKKKTVTPAKQ